MSFTKDIKFGDNVLGVVHYEYKKIDDMKKVEIDGAALTMIVEAVKVRNMTMVENLSKVELNMPLARFNAIFESFKSLSSEGVITSYNYIKGKPTYMYMATSPGYVLQCSYKRKMFHCASLKVWKVDEESKGTDEDVEDFRIVKCSE